MNRNKSFVIVEKQRCIGQNRGKHLPVFYDGKMIVIFIRMKYH